MHPSYNSRNLDNDVKLRKPASLNSYMCTVVMPCSCASSGTRWLGQPTQQRLTKGRMFDILAFYPNPLFCLDLPILSSSSCNSTYPGQITSNMFSWREARTLARETPVALWLAAAGCCVLGLQLCPEEQAWCLQLLDQQHHVFQLIDLDWKRHVL
ncbi:trypsin-3-like [Salvelinus alpinus]